MLVTAKGSFGDDGEKFPPVTLRTARKPSILCRNENVRYGTVWSSNLASEI